jgi:uncharacterized membrane protein YkoI
MQPLSGMLLGATLLFTAGQAFGKTCVSEDLSKETKITEPEARKIALARVPGTVRSEELEREHHRVVYSYDIEQSGKPGVEEVQVDAKSGKIVSIRHESDKAEEQEKKKEQ